jgi:hypothetical protein
MPSLSPSVFDRFVSSETLGVTTALVLWLILVALLPLTRRGLSRQQLGLLMEEAGPDSRQRATLDERRSMLLGRIHRFFGL